MKQHILIALAFIFTCCTNSTRQIPGTNNNQNADSLKTPGTSAVPDTRLGESNYFIQLPSTYNLTEARGKEGQLGYNLIPKDTALSMTGTIEIRHGHPIGGSPNNGDTPQEIITSNLLNHEVLWKIYVTETGYFVASTDEKGEVNASVLSKNRNEIDSLIYIISTLIKK